MTICNGCRVVTPRSFNVRMTSIADIEPKSPSKLPPLGTESMCEPKKIGFKFWSEPGRDPKIFPAGSTRGSIPNPRINCIA
jgi:hypothetical protein